MSLSKTLTVATQGESLRAKLLRGGAGSVFIKLAYTGLGLAQAVLLARLLGPSGYGIFAYTFALVSMLAMAAKFGLPNLLVRETARGEASDDWSAVHGIWRWSVMAACAISAILAAVAVVCLWVWSDKFTALQTATFLWGLALVPALALSNMVGAALRGLRYVVQGQLPEFVIRPIFFITVIITALFFSAQLTASQAMMLRSVAAWGALGVGIWLLLRQKSARAATRTRPRYENSAWLVSTLPLAFTMGMQVINQQAGILILGLFTPSDTIGIYRVATQGSILVAFGLQAVNMVLAPQFARLYRQGQLRQLQRLVTTGSRAVLLLALPVAVAFIGFGEPILYLVFGSAYVTASAPLAILSAGQLIGAVIGSVAFLLNMTGNEKDTARGAAAAAASNIVLNLIFIPALGMAGAALATVCSLILWKIVLARFVFRRIGIKTLAFHRLAT